MTTGEEEGRKHLPGSFEIYATLVFNSLVKRVNVIPVCCTWNVVFKGLKH